MTRRVTLVVLLVALVLGSALLAGRTMAQDTEVVPSGHPLVGSWLIVFPADPVAPPSLYTFGADGTVVGSSATGARHGSWEATGDRSAAFTVLGLAGPGPAGFTGLLRLRGTADVEEAGNGVALTYYAEAIAPDGTILPTAGPFTAQGARIAVELPTAPGTPTVGGATPVVGQPPVGGTPAAGAPAAGTPLVDEVIATSLATAMPEVATPMPTG